MSSMDEIEEEAKKAAEKMVRNMMQRPGQLEKVEQYKRRITHKKASIEAQLKSAVQGKLDGVSVGLKQLQECLDDVSEINTKMDELEAILSGVPPLVASLQAVREEDSRHSQYVTAMDSLKHIFTVPESVARTKQWIGEGKLLHAHQCLQDLENSRDDLLYELHRLPNQSSHDKMMLKAYFEDVELVSNLLEKQIKLILARTLNTVRKEPTVIVTALRIIEREEKRDQMALQQEGQSGFMPPGRPKRWRAAGLAVLEASVRERVEGARVAERADDKLWLVQYLELARQLVLEDLRVVTSLCARCFPPHYRIVQLYRDMFHTCLAESLQEVIASGLEGNEYVTLLAWVLNTYPGPELMGAPALAPALAEGGGAVPPLLPPETLQALEDQYLQTMQSNYRSWMEKTLSAERAAWRGAAGPDAEPHSGAYCSHAPLLVYQMTEQNLQVTNTISKGITFKALLLSIEEIARYGQMYREEVVQFKNSHFLDRSVVPHYTQHMICIINNSELMARLAAQAQARHWPPARRDARAEDKFDAARAVFQELRDLAAGFLLAEAFLDLEVHFEDLFSSRWLGARLPLQTICVTLEDYFQDYNHLRDKNFEYVINEAQNMVYKKYIAAMLSKKVSFKTQEEAAAAAAQVKREAGEVRGFFTRIAPAAVDTQRPHDVLLLMAEVIRCPDPEMLPLDLHSLVEACPDAGEAHLLRLVWLRPPAPASAAAPRDTVRHVLASRQAPSVVAGGSPSHAPHLSLFKDLTFSERARSHFVL